MQPHVVFNIGSLGNSSTGNEPAGHSCKVAGELVSQSLLYYAAIKPVLISLLLSPCANQSKLIKVAKI